MRHARLPHDKVGELQRPIPSRLPITIFYTYLCICGYSNRWKSQKSISNVGHNIFFYTESNNNNHKNLTHVESKRASERGRWVDKTEMHAQHHPAHGLCVWRTTKHNNFSSKFNDTNILPVLVLARCCWPEHGRVWFSGELQSFSSLSKWIFGDTRIITKILWMNFSNHECMTWSFFAHNVTLSCIQLHGLFKPNNL